MADPLPPIEEPRTEVTRLWLFVADQESPAVGCDGSCNWQGQIAVYPGQRFSSAPRATLRRATEADLEKLGFVRKNAT